MSKHKQIPIYELGQWIRSRAARSGEAIGRIVARSVGLGFGILPEFDTDTRVHGMSDRGTGYCVEWVQAEFGLSVDGAIPPVIGFTTLRLRWISSKSMADVRYVPCDCPVKAQAVELLQPVLPLDIEAATEATMRAAVLLGNQALDWLRAKGLTP